MRISDWSSDVCSSDLRSNLQLLGTEVNQHLNVDRAHEDHGLESNTSIGVNHPSVTLRIKSEILHQSVGIIKANLLKGRRVVSSTRSEERGVGKEWVVTVRIRWSQYH